MDYSTIYYIVAPVLPVVVPVGLAYFLKPEIAVPLAKGLTQVLENIAKTPAGFRFKEKKEK